jgi:hypothetical protein
VVSAKIIPIVRLTKIKEPLQFHIWMVILRAGIVTRHTYTLLYHFYVIRDLPILFIGLNIMIEFKRVYMRLLNLNFNRAISLCYH